MSRVVSARDKHIKGGAPGSGGCWNEFNDYAAARSRIKSRAAGFRLQEVARLRTGDADRIEAYLTCTGIGNGDGPRRADGSQRHASEIHRRRNQLYERTLARQQYLLRAGN